MEPDEGTVQKMIEGAQGARSRAYAPYSNYSVGAALLGRSGEVFVGANVENASYSATICAERAAVFAAVTNAEREFDAIVVASQNGGTPCGACRQVLSEFGKDLLVIIVDSRGEIQQQAKLDELLPRAFGPEDLVQA